MMHRLLLTCLSAMWLTTSGLTQITDHARMANPFSHARTTASVGDDYVWIMDAVIPYVKGYPLFQRWNAEGEIMKEKRIILPPYFSMGFADISIYDVVVRGEEVLAVGGGITEGMYFSPCIILLNTDGDLVNSGLKPFWHGDMIKQVQPLQDNTIFPLVMIRKNYAKDGGIYRMESMSDVPTKLNSHPGLSVLALDPSGRLLAGYTSGALCVVDLTTGEFTDTLLQAPTNISLIGFPSDLSLFVVGDEHVAIHQMDGTEIISADLPDKGYRSAFYQDQLMYLLGAKGAMHIMDANLQTVRSFTFPHAGYDPQHLAPGKDRHWVIGNDQYGAFRIPMEADGDIPDLKMDIALESIQAGILTLHPDSMYFPKRYHLEVSDMHLTVRNHGKDTLRELAVIWRLCSFLGGDNAYEGWQNWHTYYWKDLEVVPGAITELGYVDTLFPLTIYYYPAEWFSEHCLEWCMEVQTPNLRMDFNRTNDRFCIPINLATTSIETPIGQFALSVSPNPSRGEILLSGWEDGDVHIQVMNTLGVSVLEKDWSGTGNVRLDTSSWPVGIYFVRVANPISGIGSIARLAIQE